MRRAIPWLAVVGAAFGIGWWAACAPAGDDSVRPDANDARFDGDSRDSDGTSDVTDAERCDSNSQCDDHIDCTDDFCAAGGTCGHTAIHALCPDGQRCNLGTGCSAVECTGDGDCDNGLWCDGDEDCVAEHCFPGTARTCDDGDPCTEDSCNDVDDVCVRTPLDIEGCERDVPGEEATPDPFDPGTDYPGTFFLFPGQSSSCGAASYNITSLSFSTGGGNLSVSGPLCTLTQSPVPAGADFHVQCNQGGCGTYTLTGHFDNADSWTGHWTAMFSGGCSLCSSQDVDVVGVRM